MLNAITGRNASTLGSRVKCMGRPNSQHHRPLVWKKTTIKLSKLQNSSYQLSAKTGWWFKLVLLQVSKTLSYNPHPFWSSLFDFRSVKKMCVESSGNRQSANICGGGCKACRTGPCHISQHLTWSRLENGFSSPWSELQTGRRDEPGRQSHYCQQGKPHLM